MIHRTIAGNMYESLEIIQALLLRYLSDVTTAQLTPQTKNSKLSKLSLTLKLHKKLT